MSRHFFSAWLLVALFGAGAQAQVRHSSSTIPTRSALGRVGLERHWSGSVPLQAGGERVIHLSMSGRGVNERVPGSVHHQPITANRFLSHANLSTNDDFYVGARLVFTGGELKDQARDITAYAGKTRTFTVEPPFETAPAAGDAFEIRGYNEVVKGTVAQGAATSAGFLTDAELSPRDDYYVGSTLVFTSGDLQGVAREIAGYNARARQFTLTDPLPAAPASGDTFAIRGGLIFAQTNRGNLHAFDAESGAYLWTANVGISTGAARPAAANSALVFATGTQTLYALDRQTGRPVWTARLEYLPASAPTANEDLVLIGLSTGKLVAYYTHDVRDPTDPAATTRRAATFAWTWQTGGKATSRPVIADRVAAFASHDGRLYVSVVEPPSLLFRYNTGGPISSDLGAFGDRTLLVPSGDNNVYAVDLFTAETRWIVPTGAPVAQQPLAVRSASADQGPVIYVVNTAGTMLAIDAASGKSLWNQSTGGGTFLGVGQSRLYLTNEFHDLFVVNRADGTVVSSPSETFNRAGLNLREYSVSLTNDQTDRLYLATPSGALLCLRESGGMVPRTLRDPKAPRFGALPAEPEPEPGAAPAAEGVPAPEPVNP